ncbi:MAG TPA: nucleotidyltransferase family protein [Gemmatimonadaceae bacterium]|nr:nucleotidyltransferase family protein [Gemmatimonadaceae bacterium]
MIDAAEGRRLVDVLRLCRGTWIEPSDDRHWHELFALATREGCANLVWWRAREAILVTAPKGLIDRWRLQAAAVERSARRQIAITASVQAALSAIGVESCVLKGPAFSDMVYGHWAVRLPGDIDLGVRARDRGAAHRALLDYGLLFRAGDVCGDGEACYDGVHGDGRFGLELHSALVDDRPGVAVRLPVPAAEPRELDGLVLQVARAPSLAAFLAVDLATRPSATIGRTYDFSRSWALSSPREREESRILANEQRAARYLDWALGLASLLDAAADGDEPAAQEYFRRRSASQLDRHLRLAGSARDALRYLADWVYPQFVRRGVVAPGTFISWRLRRLREAVRRVIVPAARH